MNSRIRLHELLAGPGPLVIAHRGFPEVAPENTMPSFSAALDAGAQFVEMDYHHGRDAVPMVIHDATLDRTTDARRRWRRRNLKVADRAAREIQSLDAGGWFGGTFRGARVPTLEEAVDLIVSRGGIPVIEHKAGEAAACVKLLRAGGWVRRVVLMSFDWSFLRAAHQLDRRLMLGALGPPEVLADGGQPRRRKRSLDTSGLDAMDGCGARLVVWNRHVSAHSVGAAAERGFPVWVYTVDRPAVARRLVGAGVRGIITNRFIALTECLRRG